MTKKDVYETDIHNIYTFIVSQTNEQLSPYRYKRQGPIGPLGIERNKYKILYL